MKRAILSTAVCAAMLAATAGQTQAGLITATFNTTFELVSGPNLNGLDGATLQIYAEFDDTATYVENFGYPTIEALTHSVTISSASVPASNGTFSVLSGLTYFPTLSNGFFASSGQFLSGGPLLRFHMETGPGAVIPSIGDTISISHFNTTEFDPGNFNAWGDDGSQYAWSSNASLTIATVNTVVPEPSSFALLGIGACAVGAARRRRQKNERQSAA